MGRDGMGEWAATYAAQGWPVIPLHVPTSFGPKAGPGAATCSCGNPPCLCGLDRCECEPGVKRCTSQGKHPRTSDGLKSATTDPDTIARWWARWPGANIGLATGVAFDVLDLDGPTASELFALSMPPDVLGMRVDVLPGPMVVTGNGSHHYVPPTGHGNAAGMIAKGSGIDWRGAGGYVVAPPSVHYSGRSYEWAPGRDWRAPLDDTPGWVATIRATKRPATGSVIARARVALDLDAPRQRSGPVTVNVSGSTTAYGRAVLASVAADIAAAPVGERNHTLNRAAFIAGQYVAGGEIAEADALDVLVDGARLIRLACERDNLRTEGWATIRSGFDKGNTSSNAKKPADRPRGVTR